MKKIKSTGAPRIITLSEGLSCEGFFVGISRVGKRWALHLRNMTEDLLVPAPPPLVSQLVFGAGRGLWLRLTFGEGREVPGFELTPTGAPVAGLQSYAVTPQSVADHVVTVQIGAAPEGARGHLRRAGRRIA